jgi:arylsulfatase A-like enzyme
MELKRRSRGLALGIAAAIVMAVSLWALLQRTAPRRARPFPEVTGSFPDVFLLLVDTLRADHLGLYGYPRDTSPELDRFAASSIVFDDVFAPSSWTLPSVGSVMTGNYPSTHGLRAKSGGKALVSLRPDLVTLAEAFREKGYRTAAVVSNPWMVSEHGVARGFEEFQDVDSRSAYWLHAFARRMLEQEDPRPVFLYLHYMDVHGPYRRGPEGSEALGPVPGRLQRPLTAEERAAIPAYLRMKDAATLDAYVDAYDQGIRRWDRAFGRWIGWLRETGRLEGSVVVVIADHGEEFAEHGGWNHGETLYQEQLAVPWVMHVPGEKPRRVDDRVVSLIDVAPTLLAAVGVPIPATMAGRDVLADPPPPERPLLSETDVRLGGAHDAEAAQVALRRGRLKVIHSNRGRECFDLGADPLELDSNTNAECETAGSDLERRVRRLRENAPQDAGAELPLDEKQRERLRALGYVR